MSDVRSVISAILGPAENCGDAVGQINCRLAKMAPAVRSIEWVVSTSAMMFITSGTMLGFVDDAVNPAVWRGIVPTGAGSILREASEVAFRAADDVGSFVPKNKHLLGGGSQSKARFATET